MQLALPQRVASLDIETIGDIHKPEELRVAIAGLWTYELGGQKIYRSTGYISFLENELAKIETILSHFDGVVIGHNLLEFDYQVLSKYINLDGILEKTVDTLHFLSKKNDNSFRGLSLDQLAKINLGKQKIKLTPPSNLQPVADLGSMIQRLWEGGEHQLIIDYNKNDCQLTKELWLFMLEHQHILAPRSKKLSFTRESLNKYSLAIREQYIKEFSLNAYDLSVLTGQTQQISFGEWKSNCRRREYREIHLDGAGLDPKVSVIFNRLTCPECIKNFLLVSHENRVLYSNEQVICPWCGLEDVLETFYKGAMTQAGPGAFGDGQMEWVSEGSRTLRAVIYNWGSRVKGLKPKDARKRIRNLKGWSG